MRDPTRHPILWALGAGLAVLVAAFAAPLWQLLRPPPADGQPAAAAAAGDLPWQARALPDGTLAVFGLVLGRDTLADAQARLGDAIPVALVARLGEVGALEALADPFAAGFVTGRLVLALDAPPATLRGWRERSPRSQPMDDGVRRFTLQAADRRDAGAARLVGLSFVPALRLSADDLRQRFGAPASETALGGGSLLLRYPAIGMAATVGPASRGVLQYVAPREFEARLGTAAAGPAR